MTSKLSVIIIDSDENSRNLLKTRFTKTQKVKIAGETSDLSKGYALVKKINPNIIVLDISKRELEALKLAKKITQHFPDTTIFVTACEGKSEMIIKAMRAGAREFLYKPLNEKEIKGAVDTVIQVESQRTQEKKNPGKTITIFGVKGGVGTTTIATNLAVNLANHSKKSVILVDLNLQFGNSALFLNLQPKYSIVDVANNLEDLDATQLKDVLPKHSSGVRLLSEPPRLEDAETVTAAHLEQILTLLKSVFDYIVIETNNIFDEITLKALDESDSVLTIMEAELPSIYNARRCLDVFKRMGYDEEKVLLVINRLTADQGVPLKDLKKSVNFPLFWKIPNQNYETIIPCINQGSPISIMFPKSKLSINLKQLAGRLNGGMPVEEAETPIQNIERIKKQVSSMVNKIINFVISSHSEKSDNVSSSN